MCHEQPVSLVTMRTRTFTAISQTGTALSESSPCVWWEILSCVVYYVKVLCLFLSDTKKNLRQLWGKIWKAKSKQVLSSSDSWKGFSFLYFTWLHSSAKMKEYVTKFLFLLYWLRLAMCKNIIIRFIFLFFPISSKSIYWSAKFMDQSSVSISAMIRRRQRHLIYIEFVDTLNSYSHFIHTLLRIAIRF